MSYNPAFESEDTCPCGCDNDVQQCSYASKCAVCGIKFYGHGYNAHGQRCTTCTKKVLQHIPINWGPYGTNVLDSGEFALCLPDGTLVDMHREYMDSLFVLVINGNRFESKDPLQIAYIANQNEVGGRKKEYYRQ